MYKYLIIIPLFIMLMFMLGVSVNVQPNSSLTGTLGIDEGVTSEHNANLTGEPVHTISLYNNDEDKPQILGKILRALRVPTPSNPIYQIPQPETSTDTQSYIIINPENDTMVLEPDGWNEWSSDEQLEWIKAQKASFD